MGETSAQPRHLIGGLLTVLGGSPVLREGQRSSAPARATRGEKRYLAHQPLRLRVPPLHFLQVLIVILRGRVEAADRLDGGVIRFRWLKVTKNVTLCECNRHPIASNHGNS